MSQYKPDGTNFPTVTVTNGSANVVIQGVNAVSEIQTLDWFYVYGAATGRYEVSATTPVFSGGNTTVVLTTPYTGPTSSTAVGVFHRDFTSIFSFPLMYDGDLEVAAIMRRLAQLIESAIQNPLTITSSLIINGHTTAPLSPQANTLLQLQGADATAVRIEIDTFAATPVISGRVSAGTRAAPTAVTSGQALLQIDGYGRGATGFPSQSRGLMQIFATENWSDTAQGTAIVWYTTKAGGTTRSEKLRLHDEGWLLMGVTTPTLTGLGGTGQNVLEVRGSTARGAIILSGGAADADAIVQGSINWCDKNSLDADNRVAFINGLTDGTTASHRGGALVFATKPDNVNGTSERMRISQQGIARFSAANATYDSTPLDGVYGLYFYGDSSGVCHIDSYSSGGSTILAFGTNSGGGAIAERMRFISNGRALFNTTTDRTGQVGIDHNGTGSYALALQNTDTGSSSQNIIVFTRGAGVTQVGSITATNAATAYNTSSDYRLKQNIQPLLGALPRLLKLKVRQFEFKEAPGIVVDGFIAHEAAEVLPQAVHGLKDEVDENGGPVYQQVDYSKFVPLLTATVQELHEVVRSLQAEIKQLKGEK